MKATINGIRVEGTPAEIADLMKLTTVEATSALTTKGFGDGDQLYSEFGQAEVAMMDPWTMQGKHQNQEYNLKAYMDSIKTMSDLQPVMGMGDVIGDTKNYGNAQGRKPSPIDALHGHDINFLQKIATELRQDGGGEAWAIGKMVELAIEEHGQSGIMKTK